MWARNGRWISPEMPDFHVAFRNLLHAVNLRHGTDGFTSPPKEGMLRIFSPWKIRRLRSGLNPRTWVPKASTLPVDPRSRCVDGLELIIIRNIVQVASRWLYKIHWHYTLLWVYKKYFSPKCWQPPTSLPTDIQVTTIWIFITAKTSIFGAVNNLSLDITVLTNRTAIICHIDVGRRTILN